FPHTSCCGIPNGCDQTYDQNNLPPYGVQWWLNKSWLAGNINVGFSCLSQNRIQEITNWHLGAINSQFRNRFCDNKPPVLTAPQSPGGPCNSLGLDFAVSLNPPGQTLTAGGSTNFTINTQAIANIPSPAVINLSAAITPSDSNVTTDISPNSVNTGDSAVLNVG